ncbi:hypothetical protein CGRA01v4_09277 [Colletotrichum graminicola]|nr:hypothetical protein CGRA01v4_09277 [Colletotrichum graminicola]
MMMNPSRGTLPLGLLASLPCFFLICQCALIDRCIWRGVGTKNGRFTSVDQW